MVSKDVDANSWNNNLKKNSSSTTYQTYEWGQIYKFFNSQPIFFQVYNSTGEIVGQLLAHIHNSLNWHDYNLISRGLGSKLNLRKSLVWFYGPIIHDHINSKEITSKILEKIDEISKYNNVTFTRGSSHPFSNLFDEKAAINLGYTLEPWSTYIIDLNENIDTLYEKLDKKTRYDIRKSEKQNLELFLGKQRSDLNEMNYLKITERSKFGFKTRDSSKFNDDRWNFLHENKLEKLFFVKHENKTLSAILNMQFNGNVVQHAVATSQRNFHGGIFSTWNAIKWYVENNFKTYDMGGINPNPISEKERSINYYKSKWGGIQSNYFRVKKIYSINKWKLSSVLQNPKKIWNYF